MSSHARLALVLAVPLGVVVDGADGAAVEGEATGSAR